MIERRHHCLVLNEEEIADEPVQRAPRIDDRLTAHAVAGIEQDAEAHRHALIGELRDVLPVAILEHLEVVLGQAGNEPAVRVGHGDRDLHDVDPRAERLCCDEVHEGTEGHEGGHEAHEAHEARHTRPEPRLSRGTPRIL